MVSHLDLKRMRYVLEVARAESITSAAETLGVTQSALSRSIAEVEDTLGAQLFHRLPRGIQVTPAGLRFVAGAKRLLGDVDNLIAEVRESENLVSGRLRIGVAPRGYMDHVSRALKAFAHAYPGVGIEVATGTTQALRPRLLNGEFDLMVGSSSYLKRWKDVEIRTLKRLQFAILSRAGHPLALLDHPPREIDVLSYPIVLPESVEPIYSDVAQRFVHHGLPPFQPHYVVDDTDTMARILKATDAIHPLHSPDFRHIGPNYSLLPDALDLPPHFIAVAYSASRPRSPAAERFAALIAERVGAEDLPDTAVGDGS